MDGLEDLIRIEEIKRLKARYFRLMDTKRWDEWRTLFTDDMRFWNDNEPDPQDRVQITASGDAFVAMVSKLLAGASTVHHGHMPEIQLTGERSAAGVWALEDWIDDPAKGFRYHGFGHYHETYEKGDDGRWRIKDMHLTRLPLTETMNEDSEE